MMVATTDIIDPGEDATGQPVLKQRQWTQSMKQSLNAVKDFFKSPERKESNKLFHKLDTDNSKTASHDEMSEFVASNGQLWAMLAVNLDQPPEVATKVATRVAMELATGLQGQEALDAELTKEQFFQFRRKYILDPEGSQEFFHRAVFATYDTDCNNVLDEEELGHFLDIFYKSGSIFHGDVRLPPKDKLKQLMLEKLDKDKDKHLAFETVRHIISGQTRPEAHEKRKKQEFDFCDWLERMISPSSQSKDPGVKKGFCRRCCNIM